MSREAMKQALEAIESDPISHAGLVSRKQAITALRQALETEREWVGLTDEEIGEVISGQFAERNYWVKITKALESKLKEKNT